MSEWGLFLDRGSTPRSSAEKCPIFFTYNMSMGINLLATLAQKAVNVLGPDFEIEIVEKGEPWLRTQQP